MGARELTAALGGRWSGGYGTARCPAHKDRNPSLTIREGEKAPLLFCQAGCEQIAVIDALKARGLWSGTPQEWQPDPEREQRRRQKETREREQRIEGARRLWQQSRPADGTSVETYLRGRGISGPIPASIRYLADAKHSATGLVLPAMIAGVTVWPCREIIAVHRTFLTADGTHKAPVSSPKQMLGPVRGGAVRLAPCKEKLAISEGIETALSVQQATGLPTWAALSAGGIEALAPPDQAREIWIAADNDDAGLAAAKKAADRWTRQGRTVRVVVPPTPGADWNDVVSEAVHG